MHPPHGPHRIASNGQVVLPKDVLRAANLEPGDAIYVQVNDDPPGTILLVPMEIAAAWFELGRRRDRNRSHE